jgi:hypothetical protein
MTTAEQLFEEIQSAISNLMGNSSGLTDLSESTGTTADPNQVLVWFVEQLDAFLAALTLYGQLNVSISAGNFHGLPLPTYLRESWQMISAGNNSHVQSALPNCVAPSCSVSESGTC